MIKKVLFVAATGILIFCILEIFSHILIWLFYYRSWNAIMHNPNHFYQRSSNPALFYELKKSVTIVKDKQRLHINSFGVRDDTDDLAIEKIRIGILGDSIVFGMNVSQEETIVAYLQNFLGGQPRGVKVFNFGVPGYGLGELSAYLEDIYPIFKPHKVVYVLHPNDFAMRNSVYEGADNGLYRMYNRPLFVLSWVFNKFVYRLARGDGLVSARWYKWLFNGTSGKNLLHLSKMANFAKQRGFEFYVVLLPAGIAYTPTGYALADENNQIIGFLAQNGIPYVNAVSYFANNKQIFFDATDHLTFEGCKKMAEIINNEIIAK